ncbi:hypothetical protein AKJ18_29285, partial [Vibrio xuii]
PKADSLREIISAPHFMLAVFAAMVSYAVMNILMTGTPLAMIGCGFDFDKAAANELAKQMVEQQSERRVQMMERQHQMLSILTPEQKAKFVEMHN